MNHLSSRSLTRLFVLLLLPFVGLEATAQETTQPVTLSFDLQRRGPAVAPDLFGIFFEEINHGGEGGLYGEAIVNRSFDDDWGSVYGWSEQNTSWSLVQTNLLNAAQRNAIQITFRSTSSWLRNSGFDGIKVVRDDRYKISFWVRTTGDTYAGNIIARLVDRSSGANVGTLTFSGPFTGAWQKCEGTIRGMANVNKAAFQLSVSEPGTLVFDMVSVFPPTFKDRPNGMRRDLGQMLADMRPRFMRFPGGCYVEGRTGWDRDPGNPTRWEWKKTIGPIEERPGHRNQQWGYWVSDGQGYHEFLQFCEDIGAAPMFVCNVGMGHGWVQDYRDIGAFIQETLDAIEYANGDVSTRWGAERAKNGHPEPFNLKYVEIGNENCNFNFGDNSDQSDHYFERYIQFYRAIKAAWPDVITIANVEAWATDTPSWRSNWPAEVVDEHYYRDAAFYINNYEKYNAYPRSGPKVYVGEYAANIGGGNGTLSSALAEAIFMQGMENNSDIVCMSSFAPIFINETYGGWNYDLIRFNNYTAYAIPTYYVQRMFGQHQGTVNLRWTETNNVPQLSSGNRRIGVGTWLTTATFADVKLTAPDGTVLFAQADHTSADWTRGAGTWAYTSSGIRQTNATVEGATYMCNIDLPNDNFNYTLHATKTSGNEGFLIIFNYKDGQNYTWWNLGGWGNSAHGIETCINGVKQLVTRADGSLETNHTYEIRIEKRDAHLRCYLDGTLVHDVDLPAGYARGVYTSASIDETTGQAIVKLTNPNPAPTMLRMTFEHGRPAAVEAEVLTSASGLDENSLANPQKVYPHLSTDATIDADGSIRYEVPAFSFNILTIDVADYEEPEAVKLPDAAVSYTFEQELPQDDDGRFRGQLFSGASIVERPNGNHVLYTGALGSRGFMNIGTDMVRSVFSSASDYTLSIDLCNLPDNVLGSYSWALAFSNGTNQYVGFINTAGGRDWYYEARDGNMLHTLRTGAQMRTDDWHNLTYVQEGTTGRFYIDGWLARTTEVRVSPHDFVSTISGAYIARSPFAADAYMENTYFDNFRIYDQALTPDQVALVWQQTQRIEDDDVPTRIDEVPSTKYLVQGDGAVYDLKGRKVAGTSLSPGMYILDGRKVLVR